MAGLTDVVRLERRPGFGLEARPEPLVVLCPHEDRLIDANAAVCDMLGYSRQELLRRRISDVHPREMQRLVQLAELAATWGCARAGSLTCLTRDGRALPAAITARSLREPGSPVLALVTPGAAMEQPPPLPHVADDNGSANNASAPFAALAAYEDAEAILVVDAEARIGFASSGACRLTGCALEALAGRDAREIIQAHSSAVHRENIPAQIGVSIVSVRRGDALVHARLVCRPLPGAGAVLLLSEVDALAAPAGSEACRDSRQRPPANPHLRGAPGPVSAADGEGMLGHTPAAREIWRRVMRVAATRVPVLVTGESGTGKELVAQALHRHSPRAARAFVKVNCAAIPRELFESEFFGHARGAYTGAVAERSGRLELADGGTLFLDEIGELPLELQGKLLTVLEDGRFERVGEGRSRRADVRVIAATNRDLAAAMRTGTFRADLYYRLNVFGIELPPLRERLDDLPDLVGQLIRATAADLGLPPRTPDSRELLRLRSYHWPGNIRELRNLVQRALIAASAGEPLAFELPGNCGLHDSTSAPEVPTEAQRRERDRAVMLRALERTQGRIAGPDGAAALLGLKPTTLRSRLKAFGIAIKPVVATSIDLADAAPDLQPRATVWALRPRRERSL